MTELSIILVNWNCLEYTEQCLASIRDTARDIDYEVIVVDNDSADAPCQSLADNFPWIQLVLSNTNIGFGQANNLGVRQSMGRKLLFLNPDTLVLGDALKKMQSALDAAPQGGAIGCRLLNPDWSLQATCVQPFPTILNQLLALSWLQRRWPALPIWGKQALYSTEPHIVHEVDFVSGAAIMVHREVFEKVGGFSPEYFMYAEEVDLCRTIHRAGYKVLHTSDARIIHFGGQSTKNCEDGFASVTMRDSIYRFMCRNRGSSYAMLYRLTLLLSALCRMAVLAVLFPFGALFGYPIARRDLVRPFRKWLQIAQWAVGWDTSARGIATPPEASVAPVEN